MNVKNIDALRAKGVLDHLHSVGVEVPLNFVGRIYKGVVMLHARFKQFQELADVVRGSQVRLSPAPLGDV
eukprot:11886504-Alexandrium_andersonii.AAC.1